MKWHLFLVTFLAFIFLPEFIIAETLHGHFMMNELDDGQQSENLPQFEIWEVSGDFNSSNPTVKIDAVSFVTETKSGETHVFTWQHNSIKISEGKAGVYDVDLNGRGIPSNHLKVTLTLSSSNKEIESISGSLRVGVNSESVMTFRPDRKTRTKDIRLNNPSYSINDKY